ncbi:GTP pyrophosphokinase family protein [Corynebacterium sp. TA-R-1]|uniref:GTP pyrophosphokinase family protein n=1 Tax=Corynebacterium stercoris TaxID=2943490 RepID=A0ABT1G1U1_9CORY|nr:GTP pyrophosphokinase family protein [Corynebacterium stercoris]MCP1386687.1 GTP pyrophosphokinase family protein [Corynebacterium stercoris]
MNAPRVPDATIARLGSTYFAWLDAHPDIATTFRGALHELMRDAGITFDRVDVRVKTWPSLKAKARKLTADGAPMYPDPWNDIRDIIGARVTVLHSTEIPAVQRLLADQFDVLRSVDKAEETRIAGGFGYGSHHLVLRVTDKSEGLELYAGTVFEMQLRTVLQHAWAEFEHDIRYKRSGGSLDPRVDRAFTLAAGLIELADQQFDQIADITAPAPKEPEPQLAATAGAGDAELTPETLPGILTLLLGSHYPLSRANDYRFLMELLRTHGIERVAQLRDLLNPADLEAVANSLNYPFVPGQVRLVDDVLLNRFGQEHIERTWDAGNRPKLRRAKLTQRLERLRAAR